MKRGDPHPDNPALFYWGKSSKSARSPIWLTTGKLRSYRANQMRLVKEWQRSNPDKKSECNIRCKAKRRSRDAECLRAWKKRNPRRWKALKYKHHVKRLANDPFYRLKCRLRSRVRSALVASGHKKKSKTFLMLGCSPQKIRAHIESKFTDGMSWVRLREIHIDHKTPLASAKTEAELIQLFHYTNLQPLWAADNLAKGARISA